MAKLQRKYKDDDPVLGIDIDINCNECQWFCQDEDVETESIKDALYKDGWRGNDQTLIYHRDKKLFVCYWGHEEELMDIASDLYQYDKHSSWAENKLIDVLAQFQPPIEKNKQGGA